MERIEHATLEVIQRRRASVVDSICRVFPRMGEKQFCANRFAMEELDAMRSLAEDNGYNNPTTAIGADYLAWLVDRNI